jgi:hypothetical protein
MAVIQGMASPKSVPPMVDESAAPSGQPLPPVQAQAVGEAAAPEFDYDAWAAQQTAAPAAESPAAFDYDAWAQGQVAAPGAPAEEFTTEQPGFLDRIGELPSRAKAALQVTDKEIKSSLESSFGKNNVRSKDGDTEYRGKDGKWRVWDAGTTAEDFTVDLIRPVIEEAPALAATVAAGIPAVAATIGSGGTLAAPSALGVAAARSGGALVGQGLADWLQSMTGVARDEDRSALLEYGLSAVLAPVSGAAADWATKKIAQKAAQSAAKKVLAPDVLYKSEIEGIKEGLDTVKKLGGLENIPGTDTPVMLSQLNPSNPIARDITKQASELPGFIQAQEQISQGFEDSSKAFLSTLGNINPEKTGTGQEFKNYVKSAIKEEGQVIGKLRDIVKTESGNAELPIPNLKKGVEGFAESLGFKINGQNEISNIKNFLVDESGYSKQAAEVLTNKTSKLLEKVTNKEGRMTAPELLGAYEELNGLYRNVISGGSETSPLFRQKVGELRRLVADELSDKVAVIGGEGAGNKYASSLKRYKELVEAGDEFSSLLEKDALASHSLSKAIFSKGANGLDTANAAKVLLKDRPDLLNDVKGSYIQDVLASTFDDVSQKTDWGKFYKKVLAPENKEVLDVMFGPEAKEGLKAYQLVGQAIQKGSIGAPGSSQRASFVKDLARSSSVLDAAKKGGELLFQADPEKALAEIISKEGIDNFLKTAPKQSRPVLKRALTGLGDLSLRAAQVSQVPAGRIGKEKSRQDANKAK